MKIKNWLKTIKNFYYLQDFYWSKKLVELGISLKDVKIDKAGEIFIKDLELNLSKDKYLFLHKPVGFDLAKSLINEAQAKFSIDKNEELIIDLGQLKAIIHTAEELFILKEIFVSGVYNFIGERPVIVWDVGMNAGLASLYFANKENVLLVAGYEPLEPTYKKALKNLELNPEISKKIKTFNYGVGGQDRSIVVEYTDEYKGNVGIDGIPDFLKYQGQKFSSEEITIKNAGEVINSITSQYPGIDILAKIDCEGSEYELINSLYSEGKLGLLKAVMLEWHKKGPEHLVECLSKAGFTVFSFTPKNQVCGMLYAVKS